MPTGAGRTIPGDDGGMGRADDGTSVTVGGRSNAEWVSALAGHGASQAAALVDLRALLVRTARYALFRGGQLGHAGTETIDQVAQDCAQEALIAILRRLPDFRGESRFTTWACKFAINVALVARRRETWKHVSLDALLGPTGDRAWTELIDQTTPDPERQARRAEAWAAVRDVVARDLSERQRHALTAVVLHEVPLDEVVRHWASNRNAVYKLLHDARCRLKAGLEARGFSPDELTALFGTPG